MSEKHSKLHEINDLMRNAHIEDVMQQPVLELTEVVEERVDHAVVCRDVESGICNGHRGCESPVHRSAVNLQDFGINSDMQKVVDLVIKSEIKKWLNEHLSLIVREEVKKAIGGLVVVKNVDMKK